MARYVGSGVKWPNVDRAVTVPTWQLISDVERAARANLARHNRTGRLLGSLRSRRRVLAGDVVIGTNHWRFIEYGTAAHVIEPARRAALTWPNADHPVRRVRHPGTREYAPMRRALRGRARR